jgi:hypothetical protein
MNPKIKELMTQAGTDSSGKWMGVDHSEKFAELIIEECCVALHPMLRDMISRTQGVDMIVKHFRGEE